MAWEEKSSGIERLSTFAGPTAFYWFIIRNSYQDLRKMKDYLMSTGFCQSRLCRYFGSFPVFLLPSLMERTALAVIAVPWYSNSELIHRVSHFINLKGKYLRFLTLEMDLSFTVDIGGSSWCFQSFLGSSIIALINLCLVIKETGTFQCSCHSILDC